MSWGKIFPRIRNDGEEVDGYSDDGNDEDAHHCGYEEDTHY